MNPTHRCKQCQALWVWRPVEQYYSLYSDRANKCCDNEPTNEQIEALPELHPAINNVIQFFQFAHLPEHLIKVSKPFAELAWTLVFNNQNAETTVALRKLLEAKDCAVRSMVAK